jgi:pyruvate/2-oxoglutarate dehydrogenase complex dihydrolipoamide dehydrogenase (E3) component
MAGKLFDIIVIGAESGDLSIGLAMHEMGFKVLLIDKTAESIGGECLNTGCIPSKALIHVSRIVHSAGKAGQFGRFVTVLIYISKKDP